MNETKHFTISTLTEGDYVSACRVFEESISDAFNKEGLGHLLEDIQSETDHKKQKALSSLEQANSGNYLFIAKFDETVVGTISYGPCGETIQTCAEHQLDHLGELGSLYVLPSYQGQGIGSALIKKMMIFLNEQGIEQFCLDSGYKRAQIKWQRKFGEPYKVVKDYWGPDSDHMVWLCNVSDHLE
ncbi:GNAT family N-acetyltransferase [Paenibacillus sp. G2S3]|uniref:GNAT family N-acetyltransferase n=1 Tax=Paenibacillus sp. G2S3 TaxID=3047872 RepID=UPI0024C1B63E|nr:GNAT family N-acetyltransferase [Paenibacillus sp. G2S3]WHY17587.1 GNAT family N-acetyltransferase [Paenibacillus sp. G2S3]